MINEKVIQNILGKDKYEEVLWEYDDNLIQIIKRSNEGKMKFDLVFNNLENKYQIIFFLNEDKTDFTGYCNCSLGKNGDNCEHLIWSAIRVNKDLVDNDMKKKEMNTSSFKIDLLSKLSRVEFNENEINLKFKIKHIDDMNVSFELYVNVNNNKDYVVRNIEKFLVSLENKDKLYFGKELSVEEYMINKKFEDTIFCLNFLKLKYENINSSINKMVVSIHDFYLILKTLVNSYIIYNSEEYIITEGINNVDIFLRKDKEDNTMLEITKNSKYKIIGEDFATNDSKNSIHLLTNNDFEKLRLLESINFDFDQPTYKIILDKEEAHDFIQKTLPNIYNEFNVNIDNNLGINVINEPIEVTIECYKEGKNIIIQPTFMYGNYNSNYTYLDVIINKNKYVENLVLEFLLNMGYEYNIQDNTFFISNKRAQFIFLTEQLLEIQQNYEVVIDEKLKKSILNFDNSSISINVNKSNDVDYFEVNFEIPNIKEVEISKILQAFESEKTFYKLEDDTFLKLNDQRIYEQLLFVNEVVKDSSFKENKHRIPKYKALQINYEIKNKFEKYELNQSFLNYIDSISLIPEINKKEFENFSYVLRDYQKEGVSWLSNLYESSLGALLADEMGLGKTLQTISFLQIKNINKAIIVVPKALLYNWEKEFEKFAPEMNIVVVSGDKEERKKLIQNHDNNQIIITSYSSVVNDYKLYENISFEVVIIDEAQYIKNPTTKTARSIKTLKGNFFIALTGTPVQNHILELWSIFDFLLPGYYTDLNSFKKKYNFETNKKSIDLLKETSAPFILRRYKKDVLKELPQKIETNIVCEMEDKQKVIYKTYANKVQDEVQGYVNNKNYLNKNMEILSAITRLRQLSISPKLVDKNYLEDSGKVEVFLELVNQIIENEEKVLVFSQYTSLLEILKEKLKDNDINYYYLDGNTKPKDRLISVERFNKNTVPVFLISLKAGGVGLNLTSASNVIIMDPWWNPTVEDQAIDRSHRIGQENKVQVYRLISKDTIEEKMGIIKKSKEQLIQDVLESNTPNITKMSSEELINLLM